MVYQFVDGMCFEKHDNGFLMEFGSADGGELGHQCRVVMHNALVILLVMLNISKHG